MRKKSLKLWNKINLVAVKIMDVLKVHLNWIFKEQKASAELGAGARAYSHAKTLRREVTWCRGEARYVESRVKRCVKIRVGRGVGKDAGMDHLNIWYFRARQSGPYYRTSYSWKGLFFHVSLLLWESCSVHLIIVGTFYHSSQITLLPYPCNFVS